mgnify:CR=1 FL=1
MCNALKQYGPLIGRILLAVIFIMSGYNKIGGFEQTAGYMASKGLPMADILLLLTIVIELGGGIMIALGLYARWAAAIVFLFLIPVTLVFHAPWSSPLAEVQMQTIQFMKNLGIMGGMLYIAAFGSGPYSLKRGDC